jgi:hypothetical protein
LQIDEVRDSGTVAKKTEEVEGITGSENNESWAGGRKVLESDELAALEGREVLESALYALKGRFGQGEDGMTVDDVNMVSTQATVCCWEDTGWSSNVYVVVHVQYDEEALVLWSGTAASC